MTSPSTYYRLVCLLLVKCAIVHVMAFFSEQQNQGLMVQLLQKQRPAPRSQKRKPNCHPCDLLFSTEENKEMDQQEAAFALLGTLWATAPKNF
jgi:hypothetical protein